MGISTLEEINPCCLRVRLQSLLVAGQVWVRRALCAWLKKGANVAINYRRSADAAEDVAAKCRAFGVEAIAVDVSP